MSFIDLVRRETLIEDWQEEIYVITIEAHVSDLLANAVVNELLEKMMQEYYV